MEKEFLKRYLNSFPNDILSWMDGFADQMDCPYPDLTDDIFENGKRIGAWETQMIVVKKLRYAVRAERERLKNKGFCDDTKFDLG
jgi:hypothetical protein